MSEIMHIRDRINTQDAHIAGRTPSIRSCYISLSTTPERYKSALLFMLMAFGLILQGGCATMVRNPLPEDLSPAAGIPGMTDIRYWGDSIPENIDELIALQVHQAEAYNHQAFPGTSHNLAISGGGANGAFGAGLLAGWSKAGDRPAFSVVTGISTGALIAPFAFLGPQYDESLKQFYTTTETENILKIRSIFTFLSSDSAGDSTPLRRMIEKAVTPDMLNVIAAEYFKGRRLIIGTTNLDAKRPVLWDITAIAASGCPGALKLVHNVILASTSIPGIFPPVYIKVESGGQCYDEMHVDGGTTFQVFLYPPQLDHKKLSEFLDREFDAHIYIIRNARLDPRWKPVKPKLVPIAEGTIATLIMNQGMGNIELMYFLAARDGYDFNLACIPSDFKEEPKERFDSEYMKKLFDEGYNRALKGYPWQKIPPRLKKQKGKD